MDMIHEVKKAQKGDRDAFISLIKLLEHDMYGLARSMLKLDEDCADVMQETVFKAYKGLHSLKQPEYFKTWLCRILINECNLLIKKQHHTITMAEVPDTVTTVSEKYSDDEKIDLREAVDRLDETLRVVVSLHYFRDMSIKQISDVLDITEGAVKTRLYRARQILLSSFENTPEGKLSYESI
mgnify:CR=1 FL=1